MSPTLPPLPCPVLTLDMSFGMQLQDDVPIDNYGVENGSTVYLLLRLRGT